MQRRKFITLLGTTAAAWPLGARAQQRNKLWRVGYLDGTTASSDELRRIDRFRLGLRELGYVEGTNFIIESRWANYDYNRLPALAAELVRLNVDVIVTSGTPSALAAKQATTTVPIVMAILGDPVASGVVASLARPGGNITGQSFFGPELTAKRMQLLKEILPQMSQVALLHNLDNPVVATTIPLAERAAQSLNLALQIVSVRDPGEFARAFDLIEQQSSSGVVLSEDGMITANYAQLAELALRRRLPSAGNPQAARLGATIGYGIDNDALHQSAAVYIDKIFKGAKPAELPIEQATRFQFVLNLKSSKALGLDVPTETLLRADEVIE